MLASRRNASPAPRITELLTSTAADPPDQADFTEPPVVDDLRRSREVASLLKIIRSAFVKKRRRDLSDVGGGLDRPGLLVEGITGYCPCSRSPLP